MASLVLASTSSLTATPAAALKSSRHAGSRTHSRRSTSSMHVVRVSCSARDDAQPTDRNSPQQQPPPQSLPPVARAIKNALLGAACAAALVVPGSPLVLPASAEPGSAALNPPCADAASYYSPTRGLAGPALRAELHDVISGHKVFTYAQAWEALKVLDAADEKDPLNSRDVVEIYTRNQVPKSLAADAEGWNREHLWPRSYGLLQKEPEFSDLHNLRPADVNVNSSRGNKPYGECSSLPSLACIRPANREAATDTAATTMTWTPPKEVRGDIARALLYMDLRYDGHGDGSTYDLVLSDSPSVANGRQLLTASLPTELPPVATVATGAVATIAAGPVTPPPPPAVTSPPPAPAATAAAPSTAAPAVTAPSQAPALTAAPPPSSANPASSSSSSSSSSPPASAAPATTQGASPAATQGGNPNATSASSLASAPRVTFPGPLPVWLNEIHYDNAGVDEGEFLEIVTRPGVNPDDITVALYNGNDGKVYSSFKLSKFAPGSKIAGFAAFSLKLPSNGLQNGPADGVALIQKTSSGQKVVQFVSYEGELVALEGPAKGFKSTDIGVAQTDKTAKGSSLALTGKGKDYKEFKWEVQGKATPGALNPGQGVSS